MCNNPSLDSNSLTPHDDMGFTADPQAFGNVVANSTSDQGGGNTQANQVSLAHTQTPLSPANKRRTSKADDGSMADVDAPQPKAKRPKTTKSKKQVEASLSKPTKMKRKRPTSFLPALGRECIET